VSDPVGGLELVNGDEGVGVRGGVDLHDDELAVFADGDGAEGFGAAGTSRTAAMTVVDGRATRASRIPGYLAVIIAFRGSSRGLGQWTEVLAVGIWPGS